MKTETFSSNMQEKLEELQEHIKEEHAKTDANAAKKGRELGSDNLPKTESPIGHFVGSILEDCRVLYQHGMRTMDSIGTHLDSSIKQIQEQIDQKTKVIEGLIHKIKQLKNDLPTDSTSYLWRFFKFVVIGVLFILASEVAFNGLAFQVMGGSLISNMAMAIGVSMAIVILFHAFQWTLGFAKNRWQRIAIITGWVVLYTVIFIFLAQLRVQYLEATESGRNISPVMFVVTNWLLLLGAGVLMRLLPSWGALQVRMNRKDRDKEIAKLEKQLQQLLAERDDLSTHKAGLASDKENLSKHEKHLHDEVVTLARRSLMTFKEENIRYRSDGHCELGTLHPEEFNINLKLENS